MQYLRNIYPLSTPYLQYLHRDGMEGDSAPLLDSAATPRWRRWSSLVCLSLLGLGCLALAAAVTLGYFLVIKKDAVGELVVSLIVTLIISRVH